MIPRFVTVTLPPIPKQLRAQNRSHWKAKADHLKRYRSDVCNAFKAAMGDMRFERATLSMTLYADLTKMRLANGYAPKDIGNLIAAFKSGQDGIVDAGLIPDDSAKYLSYGAVKILGGKAARGRCELIVVVTEVVD